MIELHNLYTPVLRIKILVLFHKTLGINSLVEWKKRRFLTANCRLITLETSLIIGGVLNVEGWIISKYRPKENAPL